MRGWKSKIEKDRTMFMGKIRTQKEWDVEEWGGGGLYLHCRIYGVLRMLYGMGAIASWPEEATSFQARVPAAPSSVLPKSARQQNTNKIHWPFPQQLLCSSKSQHRKTSLSLHWSLCLPADSTFTADMALRSNRSVLLSKRGFPMICHRSLRKNLKFLEHSPWSETHKTHTLWTQIPWKELHGATSMMSCFH